MRRVVSWLSERARRFWGWISQPLVPPDEDEIDQCDRTVM